MLRKETNDLEFEHVHWRSEGVHIYHVITLEEVYVYFCGNNLTLLKMGMRILKAFYRAWKWNYN